MAKLASELNRKVLQNIRTQKGDSAIRTALKDTVAMGELAVQLGSGATTNEAEINTGLWVLAADGVTAVRFASQKWVQEEISQLTSGASTQLEAIDNIIEAVGLQPSGDDKGSLPTDWKDGTTYISATTNNIVDAIKDLDEAIKTIDDSIIDELEVNGVNANNDKVVYDFAQHKGLVGSAQTKNIGQFTITGYTVGSDAKLAESDTLNAALGKLQGQIDAMDKDADAKAGHVVTTVTEVDGKVTETKELLTNIVLSGYNGDHGTVTSADTLGQAIDKIEDEIAAAVNAVTVSNNDGTLAITTATTGTVIDTVIKSGEHVLAKDANNGGLYTDLDLVKITTGLPAYVKERYQLLATDDSQIGVNIDVPKDSHIVSITYISDPTSEHYQNLEYVYIDASGETQTTYVDMSNLVFESEFKSGVTSTGGIVHGVVDPQSETFLTVGADGFKLAGVQNAIDAAKASGKTEINTTVAGDATKTHMGISASTAADGHTVYEFGLYDVASAQELANLSGSVLNLDATVTGETADGHVAITIVEEDGKLTSVTLTGTDIASATALTEEITNRQNADDEIAELVGIEGEEGSRTYSHTSANYLATGNTVKEDIEALDSIIGSYDDGTTATTYDVTFDTTNTVAKSISDLKKEIDEAKSALELTATDDNKYIDATVTTAETGTTINVVGVAQDIATSTSATTGIADAYNVKQFAVSAVKDNASNGGSTRIAVVTEDDVKKLDVSNLCVDCGTF